MLPIDHRFSPRVDAQDFFVYAKRHATDSMLIYALPFKQESWQATVIVPKKVASAAVVRNAVKRRMREALRVVSTNNPNSISCLQLAVVAKPAILNRDLAAISEELLALLHKMDSTKTKHAT